MRKLMRYRGAIYRAAEACQQQELNSYKIPLISIIPHQARETDMNRNYTKMAKNHSKEKTRMFYL